MAANELDAIDILSQKIKGLRQERIEIDGKIKALVGDLMRRDDAILAELQLLEKERQSLCDEAYRKSGQPDWMEIAQRTVPRGGQQ